MEARLSRLESDVEYIKRDIGELKADVRSIRDDLSRLKEDVSGQKAMLARLDERVTHLPTKDYILTAFVMLLGIIGALVTLAPKIQAFFGVIK